MSQCPKNNNDAHVPDAIFSSQCAHCGARLDAPAVDPVVGGPRRAHYLGAPHFFNLQQACRIVNDAFPSSYGVYLVGSSLKRRDYRDVDVRCIMPDEGFAKLFPGIGNTVWRHPLWSLMCSSISLYLSRATELPIDFQIQSETEANRDYSQKDGHQRNYLGFYAAKTTEQSP